ncbi:MAG TPA: hypothetical protein VGK97_09345 [Spongiibacteraceae bacterium]
MQPATNFNESTVLTSSFDSNQSGVTWSAIFAGAAAAAVLSLVLFILGFGLGLSSLSPWRNTGAEGSTLGWAAIAWVAFTQIAASGLGGYLAGRLRVKWAQVHGDEVYFRDTAHGFLAWALASLLTAAAMGSATATIATGAVKTAGAAAATTAAVAAPAAAAMTSDGNRAGQAGMLDYYVDNLFRPEQAPAEPGLDASERSEVARIFTHSLASGELSAEDKSYLGQLIARRSGISPADAEARVSAVYNQARDAIEQAKTKAQQAADTARKTAAYTALWMFVALLCGAFIASISATWGGRQRDAVV